MTKPTDWRGRLAAGWPTGASAYRRIRRLARGSRGAADIFGEVYGRVAWGDAETKSGRGSRMDRTKALRVQLPDLLRELGVKSILDAGCGDFNWMRSVDLSDIDYVGVDVVDAVSAANAATYGGDKVRFLAADITLGRLPTCDAVLCRDVLIHLSNTDVHAALAAFRASGARLLLATTHRGVTRNLDIDTGGWRSINLELAPFSMPQPIRLVVEDEQAGKCLGVWTL